MDQWEKQTKFVYASKVLTTQTHTHKHTHTHAYTHEHVCAHHHSHTFTQHALISAHSRVHTHAHNTHFLSHTHTHTHTNAHTPSGGVNGVVQDPRLLRTLQHLQRTHDTCPDPMKLKEASKVCVCVLELCVCVCLCLISFINHLCLPATFSIFTRHHVLHICASEHCLGIFVHWSTACVCLCFGALPGYICASEHCLGIVPNTLGSQHPRFPIPKAPKFV